MEQLTLKKMREMIGWPNGEGDGLFSPGETKGNSLKSLIESLQWRHRGLSAVQGADVPLINRGRYFQHVQRDDCTLQVFPRGQDQGHVCSSSPRPLHI